MPCPVKPLTDEQIDAIIELRIEYRMSQREIEGAEDGRESDVEIP